MNKYNLTINEEPQDIIVVIDNGSANLNQFIQTLNALYNLSAKFENTTSYVNTLQDTLTAKWQETAIEVDTMQDSLTADWSNTTVDAGFF
jgi:HKD family nuclease